MEAIPEIQKNGPNGANGANGKRRKTILIILVAIGVLGVVFGARWLIFRLNYTSTDDAQVDSNLLPISAKSPGRIVRLFVSEGDLVKKGQLLARIDPTDYRLALRRAEAGLEATQDDLVKAKSVLALTIARTNIGIQQSASSLEQAANSLSITSTQQKLNLTKIQNDFDRAQLNLRRVKDRNGEVKSLADQAKIDLARAENLLQNGVISQAQLDMARTNAKAASDRLAQSDQDVADAQKLVDISSSNLQSAIIDAKQVSIAKQTHQRADLTLVLSKKQNEDIRGAQKTVDGLSARVRDMRAAVEQARIALRETGVYSPVTGVVSKKISQQYEIVAVGKPIFFLQDTKDLWITANIEETNIYHFRVGSPAEVTVDAVPGRTWRGLVSMIGAATEAEYSLIPQSNPSGQFIKVTQRIPVKIRLRGDLTGLSPGMNAVVTIRNQ